MWPRLIGAGMLVCSGVLYGLGLAQEMRVRQGEIKAFIAALQRLQAEMVFARTPLGDIFRAVGSNNRTNVGAMMRETATAMRSHPGEPFADTWSAALAVWSRRSFARAEETDVLVALGAVLGRSALDEQTSNVQYAIDRLTAIRNELAADWHKQWRLRMYLSVAGGSILAILLV